MKSLKSNGLAGLYAVRLLLLISGLGVVAIAGMILIAPEAFYAGYGIAVGGNVSLANELKAPAGALLISGLVMLAGATRRQFVAHSLVTATIVYLSYGLSRMASMATDGIPHANLVGAAGIEIVIGTISLLALLRTRRLNAN